MQFTSSSEWSVSEILAPGSLEVPTIFLDRPSWQDWGGRWTRRTAFMRFLRTVLEELVIRYTMQIQPVLLPSGEATYRPPRMQSPPQGTHGTVDPWLQGNAGFYQSDYGRLANPVFRTGVSSF